MYYPPTAEICSLMMHYFFFLLIFFILALYRTGQFGQSLDNFFIGVVQTITDLSIFSISKIFINKIL